MMAQFPSKSQKAMAFVAASVLAGRTVPTTLWTARLFARLWPLELLGKDGFGMDFPWM